MKCHDRLSTETPLVTTQIPHNLPTAPQTPNILKPKDLLESNSQTCESYTYTQQSCLANYSTMSL